MGKFVKTSSSIKIVAGVAFESSFLPERRRKKNLLMIIQQYTHRVQTEDRDFWSLRKDNARGFGVGLQTVTCCWPPMLEPVSLSPRRYCLNLIKQFTSSFWAANGNRQQNDIIRSWSIANATTLKNFWQMLCKEI